MGDIKTDAVKKGDMPYTIERSEKLGRYLAAARDLPAGTLILREKALLVGPRVDSPPVCLACYRPLPTPHPSCALCRVAPLCGPDCQNSGDHSDAECAALRTCQLPPDNVELSGVTLPFRCLLLRRSDQLLWSDLLQLEAHLEERRGTPVWEDRRRTVVEVLRRSGLLAEDEDDELVQRVCGVVDVNSFELRGPVGPTGGAERLRGLFTRAALMAHDCFANTHLAVDDSRQMAVHASVAIAKGSPIFFNYTSAISATEERQEHLREGKYFDCSCARCSDASEGGTHLSSLRCVRCASGRVMPGALSNDAWRCVECGHNYSPRLVRTTLGLARAALEDADRSSVRAMETLLVRLARTLAGNHALLIEVKQNLVALYRDHILRDPNPSRRVMQRKAELCRNLLPVLEVVEPGISRLRGIALYELHVPLVLLAHRDHQAGEISAGELLSRLREAEQLLRESAAMLLYEPPSSPEGHLARVALGELRALRDNIAEVEATGTGAGTGGRRQMRRRR